MKHTSIRRWSALLLALLIVASLTSTRPAIAGKLDVRLLRFQPEDASLDSVFRYLVHRR